MNEIIALPHIAELLATKTTSDIESSEKFIKAFFAHIEDALTVSESVTINGLGTFERTTDPTSPLTFTPDKVLADELNQPFEMFEPIAIGDSEIETTQSTSDPENEPETILESETDTAIEDMPATETTELQPVDEAPSVQHNPENETLKTEEEVTQDSNPSTDPVAEEPTMLPDDDETPEVPVRHSSHTIIWFILIFIIGLIAGVAAGYFEHEKLETIITRQSAAPIKVAEIDSIVSTSNETQIETNPIDTVTEPIDSTISIEQPVEIEHTVVYDTVTPQRFLTTMARQYYNQMEYWVFIYNANADKLGNPNRIKPGTSVIIPDKSEFADGETPQQTLQRAKKLSREIYNRFK